MIISVFECIFWSGLCLTLVPLLSTKVCFMDSNIACLMGVCVLYKPCSCVFVFGCHTGRCVVEFISISKPIIVMFFFFQVRLLEIRDRQILMLIPAIGPAVFVVSVVDLIM